MTARARLVGRRWYNGCMGINRGVKRLRIIEGRPWKEALLCVLEPYSPYRAWYPSGEAQSGDVGVVVVHTEPRTVLCAVPIESEAALRHTIAQQCRHGGAALPTVAKVEQTAGMSLSEAEGQPLDSAAVMSLIQAANDYQVGLPQDRTGESSAAAGRILLQSGGRCACCDALDPAVAGPQDIVIHQVSQADFDGERDWPALLCAACQAAMAAAGMRSVLDYQFSLRPACPFCAAQRTLMISYGKPTYAWAMNMPGWVRSGGCCVDYSKTMECERCGFQWGPD